MRSGETPQEMPVREKLDLLDQEKAQKQQLPIFSNSVLGDCFYFRPMSWFVYRVL
jgi:hypothetical protein